MLKYLIIQLADDAVSYCHFDNEIESEQFISADNLKAAIRFGMLENLNIQFVYPNRALPEGYDKIIETIDHTKIMPCSAPNVENADIVVCNNIAELENRDFGTGQIVILRITRDDIDELPRVYGVVKAQCFRLNIVITDIDKFTDSDFDKYKEVLSALGEITRVGLVGGNNMQFNLLTDRLALKAMNNCNAGDESITLMPNGKFYPCAGFYYDNANEDFGDLSRGVEITNRQLFKLGYAPICRHCDAFHCRRCVWLNRKTTLEVNTPSHEQCVVAHLERNESGKILSSVRKEYEFSPEVSIPEIDYLDPFVNRKKW